MYSFGSGVLYGTRGDIATQTPVRFGGIQDVSIDFSFSVKELHGLYQFPLAIARGTGKINGKAKAATINARTFNDLFFGQAMAAGVLLTVNDEVHSIPGVGPYTIDATHKTGFGTDLGVVYSLTGIPLVLVTGTPATGQYSQAAGTYTFAAADTALGVRLNYTYTPSPNTSGSTITLTNQLLGTTPLFSAVFTSTFEGKKVTFTFPKCTSSKLNFVTKMEDFVIPEFDFGMFSDDSGTIGTLSFDE